MDSIEELIEKIRLEVKASVKEKRYEHSVRVAETSRHMCTLYGLDPDLGYLAGIAHDLCKSCEDEEFLALAAMDGNPITEVEKFKPSLLHGRAAAVRLRKDFGVTDEDVIQAVACHTLGGTDLCDLAKIVYAADKIEPGRPQSTDEYRSRLFAMSLNRLLLSVVEENIEYLKGKGKKIAPSSMDFRQSLLDSIAKEGK